ncbi:FtsZ/tubulin family protein [Halorussus amylolyticus]|uniref:cell division protein FtsZ n=1 Tax=Halorussus amylolyticus TaxID=1126242 RepID=UPI0010486471|nr:cell division protein FtsZ [Halorussus amylolyticus]
MVYVFAGTGQAGSAIVDDVFGHRRVSTPASPLVFNSTIRDLRNLSNIDEESQYGIAERHGLVERGTPGFEEQVTGGFGRNPVEADSVMEDHRGELVETLAAHFDEPDGTPGDIPFAFVCLGLGGGTGCGIAPHVADAIKEYTDGVAQIIGVGVLPNTDGPVAEDDDEQISAGRQAWNTIYGLDRLEESVDGIVLVDNQRLAYENAAEGRFSEYNEYVASGLVDLISGSTLERIDPSEYDEVDPPVVDLQDVVTSLSFDTRGTNSRPGYATIGRSVTMTKSLVGYLVPFVGDREVDSSALSRLAASKQTLSGVSPSEAQKAIGLIRAPVEHISNEGKRIETSTIRRFLESQCSEVNLGVALTRRNLASFTSLFTYERDQIDRIAEIEDQADQYEAQNPI